MKKISIRLISLCLAAMQLLCFAGCDTQVPEPTVESTTLPATEATTQATTVVTTEGTEPANYSVLESTDPIKNIILIIGDGMGLKHIEAGELYDGKAYGFTAWPMVKVNTQALDENGELSTQFPDSTAASTAMATGTLTMNNLVGRDMDGNDLQTILDVASAMGKATGVVTTDTLFGGTPAGYTAHANSRSDTMVILESQLVSGVNLLCGSAQEAVTAMAEQIRESGYAYCENYEDLSSTFESDKAYWQLPVGGNDAQLRLAEVSLDALNYLSRDTDGFVLVIEHAHIDKYCHHSGFQDISMAVSSLNQTVEAVMNWLGDRTDTAVLVTADHETGSLQVSDKADKYENTVEFNGKTISYELRTTNHTTTNVALFVYGVTADFTKSDLYKKKALKNTGIYYLMEEILNIGHS